MIHTPLAKTLRSKCVKSCLHLLRTAQSYKIECVKERKIKAYLGVKSLAEVHGMFFSETIPTKGRESLKYVLQHSFNKNHKYICIYMEK